MDKIILTNIGALRGKYGARGVTSIRTALKALVAADKKRGLSSLVVALDDVAQMKSLAAPVVTNPVSTRQNKLAVDALYKGQKPAYIMLVGAPDVIPHQSLVNPVFDGVNDPDKLIPSDLPYACDTPFGSDPARCTGPTRVVGRLPDLMGGTDPAYLIGLITTATTWQARPRSDYASYLGVTAQVWEDSTALSLTAMFGASDQLQICPPSGSAWSKDLLGRRVHFFNCHGALADPHFYGQQGNQYPIAHDSAFIAGHAVTEGTVVAAECCYGAELYNPKLAGGHTGIGNTYMSKHAYAFLGSSTIAYGPASGNGSADFICQYFLANILAGASVGRAHLMARQQFIRISGVMDPVELKTLAQFNLLGDPSIQPVAAPAVHGIAAAGGAPMRQMRRRQLAEDGKQLAKTVPVTVEIPAAAEIKSAAKAVVTGAAAGVSAAVKRLMKSAGLDTPTIRSFAVTGAAGAAGGAGKGASGPSDVHVILGRRGASDAPVPRGVALVVWESNGTVISYRELDQR